MVNKRKSASVGAALDNAVSAILRWSTRSGVRRSMISTDGERLSMTDSWLLDRISVAGPLRLSQLAEWQAVDKSTMTAQVQRLERRQLVRRAPDPLDGRAVLVSITPVGMATHQQNRVLARAIFDDLVTDWSSADKKTFSTLLNRFAAALSEQSSPVVPSQASPDA